MDAGTRASPRRRNRAPLLQPPLATERGRKGRRQGKRGVRREEIGQGQEHRHGERPEPRSGRLLLSPCPVSAFPPIRRAQRSCNLAPRAPGGSIAGWLFTLPKVSPMPLFAYVQDLNPLGNRVLSTVVAALPVLVLFYLLVGRRWLASWAGAAGAVVAIVIASAVYGMPLEMAAWSFAHGAAFGLVPIGLPVFGA